MLTLLLLSGGCRVGQNVLDALGGRRDGLRLVATSSVADEPALFDFDAVHLVPATAADPRGFERRLLAIVDGEGADLVVPCRDDDVTFLGDLRERRPDLAPRLLCGDRQASAIVCDKWLAYRFCAARGLPFVASTISGSGADCRAFLDAGGLPAVVKPRRGFASGGIRIVWNEAQLARALGQQGYVAQRYIGDPRAIDAFREALAADGVPLYYTFQTIKHSIQVLVGPQGRVEQVVCTRNQLNLRRAKRLEPDDDPAARELGAACAGTLTEAGWRGPLNIQCQRDADGRLVIHEFNGRFTGATAARERLGMDEVGPAIERFAGAWPGMAATATPARIVHEGLAARSVDPRRVDTLAREGVWRAEAPGPAAPGAASP